MIFSQTSNQLSEINNLRGELTELRQQFKDNSQEVLSLVNHQKMIIRNFTSANAAYKDSFGF